MRVGGVNRRVVWLARLYEMWFGKFGDYHLTVSQAMKADLVRQMPTIREDRIYVLYDRATDKFKPRYLDLNEKGKLYERIGLENQIYMSASGSYGYCENRAAFLLSSTSYTPDEDFSMLVEALDLCDADESVPAIQMVVTGKGPLKVFFDSVFRARNSRWKKTHVRQAWLSIDDYPKVVSAADLGVCLHASSSGLDLPMKVVDMFSARLPCLALGGFASIPELVKPEYGHIFLNKQELYEEIRSVLKDFDYIYTTPIL